MTDACTDGAASPAAMTRYPTEWIDVWQLRDRTRLTVRPVLPQDAPLLAEMVRRLLPGTRNRRFHGGLGQLSDEDSLRLCRVDHQRHVALVVTIRGDDGGERLVAEARYALMPGVEGADAEFAIVVDDRWQRRGVGLALMEALLDTAHRAGVRWLCGEVLAWNEPMIALARRCGFCCRVDRHDATLVRIELLLGKGREARAACTGRRGVALLALSRWLSVQIGGRHPRRP